MGEHGGSVNEAPAALYYTGKTYLTFSAPSCCWTNYYVLGLLIWDGSSDPATSAAWSKKGLVLSSANGNYGHGSNGILRVSMALKSGTFSTPMQILLELAIRRVTLWLRSWYGTLMGLQASLLQ